MEKICRKTGLATQVKDKKLFHVNRITGYSPDRLLSIGDVVDVGEESNPFFGYYHKQKRSYPVTIANNQVQEISGLAFLRQVQEGKIQSPHLPNIAYDVANHFMMLSREMLWESIRLEKYPDLPSRQRCMWLVKDMNSLMHWRNKLQSENNTQYIEFSATGKIHECDASFLMGDSELLSVSYENAKKYWRGEMNATNSEPELLFEGTLEVTRVIPETEFAERVTA
jgi:hypothetical protein